MALRVSIITPKYKLLKPVKTSSDAIIRIYNRPLTIAQLEKYILKPAEGDLVAVDIETRGLTPFYPHTYKDEEHAPKIMGVGFAWVRGTYRAAYIDLNAQSESLKAHLCKRLGDLYLIAHNSMFDGLWLRHLGLSLGVDVRPNWVADTYGLFKQTAPKDYIEQRHGLKDAQVELLGWDEKGDVALDEWLVNNGFYKESGPKGERIKKAEKGEMWRVPTQILGHYCALDCVSTLQLFDHVFEPVMKRFPMLWEYHEGPFIRTIHELIDQQIHGMSVDIERLSEVQKEIEKSSEKYIKEFFEIEEIRPYLQEWRDLTIEKKLSKEPGKRTKKGALSKNWVNWTEKWAAMLDDEQYCFNPGSDKQLQWLFYERMFEAEKEVIEYNRREITCYRLKSPRGSILLPATEAGQPPIDKKATPWLGVPGAVLSKLAKQQTSLTTFVRPYLNFSSTSYSGRMHPGWKVPEAVTGRLGGAKPNVQQITGDPRVLECLVADPGYVIVERDFAALEDYVAANVTECPGLLALYGPAAKANDGHLWLGSQLPVIGDKIREAGYDKDNPDKDTIARVKESCKKERDIAKKAKYSATYGIGAFKLWQDFMCEGVDITLDETAEVLYGYWDVFEGMKEYKYYLKDEWERNRGWIYNAIGRPMSVGDKQLKDLFSRCVQGGGHDLQMMFGMHVADLVKANGLDARPYIYDLHDATYWQVREDQLEKYLELSTQATDKVWDWCVTKLGWTCRLKTSFAYGRTLRELKGK